MKIFPLKNNYFKICSIVILVLFFNENIYSQCCSANPVVGSTNVGLLSKNTLREIAYYRYNYSDTYYEGNNKQPDIHYLKYAWYSYVGNIISFGISNKFTADLEIGYYIRKQELTDASRKLYSQGWNNGILSVKYGLVKHSNFECTIGSGLKFPFTKNVLEDNYGRPLSVSLQTSTNAFGGVFLLFLQKNFPEYQFRIVLNHRTEAFNGYNSIYYMKGNTFFTSLFLSKSLNTHWNIIIQLRNEYRTRDYRYDKAIIGTGGYVWIFSPQINFNFKGFYFSLLYDKPFYYYTNEKQIVNKYAISFICTKDFNL